MGTVQNIMHTIACAAFAWSNNAADKSTINIAIQSCNRRAVFAVHTQLPISVHDLVKTIRAQIPNLSSECSVVIQKNDLSLARDAIVTAEDDLHLILKLFPSQHERATVNSAFRKVYDPLFLSDHCRHDPISLTNKELFTMCKGYLIARFYKGAQS